MIILPIIILPIIILPIIDGACYTTVAVVDRTGRSVDGDGAGVKGDEGK